MDYIKITFTDIDTELRQILVALLMNIEYEAFEEESNSLSAYVREDVYDEAALQETVSAFDVRYTVTTMRQENWNQQWESSFEPVVVGDFCVIRAPFHKDVPKVTYDIVITPKMSFGTGHHATTQLMISEMEQLNFNRKIVLDFGCGTAILAILAEKLGAGMVLGVDNDEWSVENAIENCAANNCNRISVQLGSFGVVAPGQNFDIILANINRHILIQYMQAIHDKLNEDGTVLMSGLLAEDEAIIRSQAEAHNLAVEHVKELNGWIVIRLQKI